MLNVPATLTQCYCFTSHVCGCVESNQNSTHNQFSFARCRFVLYMTIHNLYIFSRSGECLFYAEWFRPVNTLKDMPDEDRKLMYGLIISLKHLMNKANPVP